MNRRQFLQRGGTAVVAPLTAGCTLLEPPTDAIRVTMVDRPRYKPRRTIIGAGTTVTWENTSTIPRTVTAYEKRIPDAADYFASGGFESERTARTNREAGIIKRGEAFTHTFYEPGAYWYCSIPQESIGMIGIVQVK